MESCKFFQYDYRDWVKNPFLVKRSKQVPWNSKDSYPTRTFYIQDKSPLMAFFSYQSVGAQGWKSLQQVQTLVPLNASQPLYVWTTPMQGCSWIIAKLKDCLLVYHDRHPMQDLKNKMNKIREKGAVKIYRLDDLSNKNQYTTHLYAQKKDGNKVFGAQMMLNYNQLTKKWVLFIQDMELQTPRKGDALPSNSYKLIAERREIFLE